MYPGLLTALIGTFFLVTGLIFQPVIAGFELILPLVLSGFFFLALGVFQTQSSRGKLG